MEILKSFLLGKPKHPAECPFSVFENSLFNTKYYPSIEKIHAHELNGKVLCNRTFRSIGNYHYMELLLDKPEYQCQLTQGGECLRVEDLGVKLEEFECILKRARSSTM